MAKYKLEYLWLDGYKPVPNIRGKNTVDFIPRLASRQTLVFCVTPAKLAFYQCRH